MTGALVAGLLTGLSLIVAIGAQNAFVLRQGLAREHVGVVVLICATSDVVLILAGVGGIGTVVEQAPWVLDLVQWLGVAFLTGYGVAVAAAGSVVPSHSTRPVAVRSTGGPPPRRALALTWLNPHVYLDTVILIGSIANQNGPVGRWWFAAGAVVASAAWFVALGYGARLATRLLTRPRAWQVLDIAIGLTMLAIAVTLALG